MIATLLTATLALADPVCAPALICGVENGEDLERVEGTPWIIASSVNGANLYRIDSRTGAVRVLSIDVAAKPRAPLPNSLCPGPLSPGEFSGHGIAVRQGRQAQLLAVNHARGSIEIFDIAPADARLTWRGCVKTPDEMAANGVAPLPGGGIAATRYATPGEDFTKGLAAGTATGDIRTWSPRDGWSIIPSTEASVANGIAASRDGKRLFVAVTGTREIWRITLNRRGTPTIERASLEFSPDNLRWGANGQLLTAGFNGSAADAVACFARPECSLAWSVAMIDPDTLKIQTMTSCPATASFGNATTALPVGDEIWIGTFRGHAIARVARRSANGAAASASCSVS